MAIELQCQCGQRLRISEEHAGKQGRCPVCGHVLDIPDPEGMVLYRDGDVSWAAPSTALTEEPPAPQPESTALTDEPPPPLGEPAFSGPAGELPVLVRPAAALSSPGQIGLAAFLGGPLAGCLLIARNYARLGNRGACWLMVLVGVLVTAAAVGSAFLLPDLPPGANLILAVPLWLGVYAAGKALQGPVFHLHRQQGGAQASGWSVVGYTGLGVAFTLALAFGIGILHEATFGDRHLQVSAVEEIYYSRDITESEARQIGRVLQEVHFFDGNGAKSVRLSKDGGEYVLSFVLLFGFDNPEWHAEFQSHAQRISAILGGRPVRVELCDTWMTSRKKLPAVRAREPLEAK